VPCDISVVVPVGIHISRPPESQDRQDPSSSSELVIRTMAAKCSGFVDESIECAICFEPLDGDNSGRTIELACGHRWHLDCIREQLRLAQPSKSRRLMFHGTRCGKCAAFCDHPELENLTRRTDGMRGRVDELVREQLAVDRPDEVRGADAREVARLLDEGRRRYAFYLCGGCDSPYFGGTADCADETEGELTTAEERLCPACSTKSQEMCEHPFEHRPYHVWKCRYCCRPSVFVCYGSVHFCDQCHERNAERVAARAGAGSSAAPPPLEPIPCRGEECEYPKPEGRREHRNGPGLDCEQVYYCAACESCPAGGHAFMVPPGSRNLLSNPSGEQGTTGWRTMRQQRRYGPALQSWYVEDMETPVDGGVTTTNFVSSYYWSVMAQTVQLGEVLVDPSGARIEVSAKFMGRTDCPSVFCLDAVLTDAAGVVLRRETTGQRDAPADFWERSSLLFEPTREAHAVTVVVSGKDSRFWNGNFGSKCCHCSVRVLGTEEELDELLLERQMDEGAREVDRRHDRQNYEGFRAKAVEMLLPIVLVFFLWLVKE